MKASRHWQCSMLAGVLAFVGLFPLAAEAASPDRHGVLPAGGTVKAPMGWVQFCAEHPGDCHAKVASPRDADLDRQSWQQLVQVNVRTNADIEQVSDEELYGVPEYWTYPTDNKGDCEDIALEKKRRLIALGWRREALLMTVVRDLKGEGHAVLLVKTNRGDYVLDNNTNEVKLWFETGYGFIKRQSMADPNAWVSLGPSQNGPAVVSQPRP